MRTIILLSIIVLLGTTLRFWGISYDLPNLYTADESAIMNRAVTVADGNLRHRIILLGSLPYYTIGAIIKIVSLVDPHLKNGQHTLWEAFQLNKTPFYLIGRSLSAFYGVTTLVLVYFLGRILFGSTVGIIASFLVSITPLSVKAAHLVTADTVVSAFMLVTTLLTLHAYRTQKRFLFLYAAISSGLSAAQKFPGIFILPLVILFYLISKQNSKKSLYRRLFFVCILIALSSFAYFVSYPYMFKDLDKLLWDWRFENGLQRYWDRPPHIDLGQIFRIKESAVWLRLGAGSFIFYGSIIGYVYALKYKNLKAIIIGLFAIAFFYVNTIPIKINDNRYIPIIPLICIFASYAIVRLKGRLRHGFILLILFVSIAPFTKSIFLANAYGSIDTRMLLRTWVTAQHLNESTILRDPHTDDENTFIEYHDIHESFPTQDRFIHRQTIPSVQSYQYAIVNDWFAQFYFSWELYYPSIHDIVGVYKYIASHSKTIAEFTPKLTLTSEEDLDFLLHANRWTFQQIRGPRIVVYKLR